MASEPRVAIVGGGPGGLTLARVLQVRGIAATVLEREESGDARSQGGTLDMHADGGQFALRAAGLEAEFAAVARPEDRGMRVFDPAGRLHYDDSAGAATGDRPEVDRGALRAILLESLAPGVVRWGCRVESIGLREGGISTLAFADGHSEEFDLVVGADGARSRVRPLVSAARPEYTGVTFVELAIADADARHPAIGRLVGRGLMFALGQHRALIAQRNGHGRILTYAGLRVPEAWATAPGFDWSDAAGARAALRSHFEGWDAGLLALIDRAGDRARPWPLYALPVGHRWASRAGVTLIGDSAHLMPPNGDGANLAMRDAADLAAALAGADPADWPRAVAAFEAAMGDRAEESARGAAEALAEWFGDDGLRHVVEFMEGHAGAA